MPRGFGKVPGFGNPDEWDRPPLDQLNIDPGDFEAWVAATDLPPAPGKHGSSACAYEIRRLDDTLVISEMLPGRPIESDEQKAYVAAVLAALDRVPAFSTICMYCLPEWVVNAINGGADKWRAEGRLDGRKAVVYAQMWKLFLDRRARITRDPKDVHAKKPDEDDERNRGIIARLMESARRVRPVLRKRR